MHQRIYQIPSIIPISRNDDTELLYSLEEQRSIAIQSAAKELGRVLGEDESDFWSTTIVQALCDILESFERGSAIAAAVGFLQYHEFKITGIGTSGRLNPSVVKYHIERNSIVAKSKE